MSTTSRSSWFLCFLALLGGQASEAHTWGAAIRERFVGRQQHEYGGDSALRVRRVVQEWGFQSLTLTTRLQMTSNKASRVFTPPIRSRRSDLETMIASIHQGKGEIVLKPLISTEGGLGVTHRLTDIDPEDPAAWFTSYEQALVYLATVAARRDVSELVVGIGLHHLWKAEHADSWIALLQELQRHGGRRLQLSLEITSQKDFEALETWKKTSPTSFAEFLSHLDSLRFSIVPVSTIRSGSWNPAGMAYEIERSLDRLSALAPEQRFQLANLTLPACRQFQLDEDEIHCTSSFDASFQASGLNAAFAALKQLSPSAQDRLIHVEMLVATTDYEPHDWNFDPRFPYYNPLSHEIFVKQLSLLPQSNIDRSPQSLTQPTPQRLACVYYDSADKKDLIGPIHARMMENLTGAFANWKVSRRNSKKYTEYTLADCDIAFYIATHYSLQLPFDFYAQLAEYSQKKTLVWMNYRLQEFEKAYNTLATTPLAFTSLGLSQAERSPSPNVVDPGFYRWFEYKGVDFEKLSKWDYRSNRFMSSPELHIVKVLDSAHSRVWSQARHSSLGTHTPYVIQQETSQGGSVWYFADSPFSYVHYEDRYLILCDLMWDLLQEPAPDGPLGALVRLEDLNPSQHSDDLRWAFDFLGSEKVPFGMALIPFYANTFGTEFTNRKPTLLPVTEYREFVGSLRYGIAQGGQLIWHGVYHHAGDHLSGFDGASGPDYEFWLYPEDTPLPEDSPDYVLDQLEKGEQVFQKLGLRPVAWEVPHYASSALDSVLFGKLFQWNYHRSLYFWSEVDKDPALGPQHRMFNCLTPECREERRRLARETHIETESLDFAGQPIPFRVWKDSYGQALIPETLGMIDYVFYDDHTWRPVSHVEDLLRRARMLRVIRGSFASFFWHPDVANPSLPYYQRHPGHYDSEGGKHTLIRLIHGLKEMGYTFRSIGDCSLFPRDECR